MELSKPCPTCPRGVLATHAAAKGDALAWLPLNLTLSFDSYDTPAHHKDNGIEIVYNWVSCPLPPARQLLRWAGGAARCPVGTASPDPSASPHSMPPLHIMNNGESDLCLMHARCSSRSVSASSPPNITCLHLYRRWLRIC